MSIENDLTILRYLLRKIYHVETRIKKLKTWMIFDLWLDNVVVDFMIYKNVQDISKHLDSLKSVVVRLIKQQLN